VGDFAGHKPMTFASLGYLTFILLLLPDLLGESDALTPQLGLPVVRTIAFLPSNTFPLGPDLESFWQIDDSHRSKKGIEITAEKIV
jgi:hypothetical protein